MKPFHVDLVVKKLKGIESENAAMGECPCEIDGGPSRYHVVTFSPDNNGRHLLIIRCANCHRPALVFGFEATDLPNAAARSPERN